MSLIGELKLLAKIIVRKNTINHEFHPKFFCNILRFRVAGERAHLQYLTHRY